MIVLWFAAILVPMLVALAVVSRGAFQAAALWLAPWTALPALVLALLADANSGYDFSWLMLGTRMGLDVTGQVFLLAAALVWLAAGIFARDYLADDPRQTWFWFFFLLSMSGNLGLILVGDVVSFYLFFALMTFAAYGVVVHDRGQAAFRAGRVYLTMAVAGEMCILAGMLFTVWSAGSIDLRIASAAVADSPQRDLVIALFLAGFGVKVGALPLHMWLPLAHPVAPTPASAVLSGCMLKAGLLGWVRFLPLGIESLPGWGQFIMAAGLVAAFFGVLAGLLQNDPKTLLAYSSVSQMGLITLAIGVGFLGPDSWDLALVAVAVYVFHHSLAKGALFLGVGVAGAAGDSLWRRRAVLTGMAIAALTLAGAPLTSGALAKTALKDATHTAHAPWADLLLTLSAIATTLLMARFLLLIRAQLAGNDSPKPFQLWIWLPWTGLVALVGSVALLLPWYVDLEIAGPTAVTLAKVWSGLWPVLAGVALFGGGGYLARHFSVQSPLRIPPGDLIVPIEAIAGHKPDLTRFSSDVQSPRQLVVDVFHHRWLPLRQIEGGMAQWGNAGMFLMSMLIVFLLLLSL
ncbi:hypothetical protein BH23CHL1_BH23CHL1_22090 [soil metagenome]